MYKILLPFIAKVNGERYNYRMSGHSKWATIKRAKGAADLKRGLTFTKLSNAITIAVKQSGGTTDIDSNFKLRLLVEEARAVNMPKENIERAIQRAVSRGAGELEEVVYEGFAPGGVSVIIEAATDNSARTTAEIKSIFNKESASFGQPGSVAYQFKNLGKITAEKSGKTYDDFFEMAVEAGAEDLEEDGGAFSVFTKPENMNAVKDALTAKGVTVSGFELIRKPTITVPISDPAKREQVIGFLEKLEDLDDVQKIYSNLA